MLAYLLAIGVGLGSLGLYLAAFFLPELHRKYDLVWSGVGMFYALVLWVCAGRITGGVLLGQIASSSLIGWFTWQTLALRQAQTPLDQRTPYPAPAKTLPEALRLRWRQFQGSLQDGSWKAAVPNRWEQPIDRIADVLIAIAALISTTFQPQASPPAAPPPIDQTAVAIDADAEKLAAEKLAAQELAAKPPAPLPPQPWDA